MSLRDEAFRRLLGREPGADEQTDIAAIRDAVKLGDNDPFWGIVAFLYARTQPDIEGRAQLKITQESLEAFGKTLNGALECITSLPAHAGGGVSQDGLASLVEAAVASALEDWVPRAATARPSIKTWLGEHFNAVLHVAGGLVVAVLISVAAAYWAGQESARQVYAVRQATIEAEAHTLEAWARTPNGRRVYAWGTLNAPSLGKILSCGYPGWTRTRQDGYTVCYPNGSGHGFYLPAP